MATVPQRVIRPIAGAANRPTSRPIAERPSSARPAPVEATKAAPPRGSQLRSDRVRGLATSAALHLVAGLILAVWSWTSPPEDLPLTLGGGLVEGTDRIDLNLASPVLKIESAAGSGLGEDEAASARELVVNTESGTPIAPAAPVASDGGPAAVFETAKEGDVAFFGAASAARSFVFVVDLSGSMQTNRRFDRLVNELTATIQTLSTDQQFSVVFFNDHPLPLFSPRASQGLIPANKGNKQRAIRWIRSRRPDGLTNPDLALEMALAMRPGAVYFLTDGEIVGGDQLLTRLARWNDTGIPIHTLAFESREGEETLIRIAKQSGGTYRFVE